MCKRAVAYGHGRWAEAASTGALNMELHRDIVLNYVLSGFGIPKLGMAWKAQGEKKKYVLRWKCVRQACQMAGGYENRGRTTASTGFWVVSSWVGNGRRCSMGLRDEAGSVGARRISRCR